MTSTGDRSQDVLNKALLLRDAGDHDRGRNRVHRRRTSLSSGLARFAHPACESGRACRLVGIFGRGRRAFVTLLASRLPARVILTATLLLFAVRQRGGGHCYRLQSHAADAGHSGRYAARLRPCRSFRRDAARSPARSRQGLARANIGFVLGVLLALPAGVALARRRRLALTVHRARDCPPLPMTVLIAFFFRRSRRTGPPVSAGNSACCASPCFSRTLACQWRSSPRCFLPTHLSWRLGGACAWPSRCGWSRSCCSCSASRASLAATALRDASQMACAGALNRPCQSLFSSPRLIWRRSPTARFGWPPFRWLLWSIAHTASGDLVPGPRYRSRERTRRPSP